MEQLAPICTILQNGVFGTLSNTYEGTKSRKLFSQTHFIIDEWQGPKYTNALDPYKATSLHNNHVFSKNDMSWYTYVIYCDIFLTYFMIYFRIKIDFALTVL